jgi:putative component of membrane protein insertase Oxa1/YidC/SpoIIIJ protein YidD
MKQPQFKNKVSLSCSTPNVGRKNRRRASILGMILFFTLLWTQTSSAENPLLRGPRKVVRSNAEAPKPVDGKQGLLEEIAAAPVLFYQRFLGPHWGWRCAYHPSCSNYSLLAIRKHGALFGSIMTFDRLQHEADEVRYSPLILTGGQIKVYDPLENNDYWWHMTDKSAMEEIIPHIRNEKNMEHAGGRR